MPFIGGTVINILTDRLFVNILLFTY